MKTKEYGTSKEVVKYLEGLISLTATADASKVVAGLDGRKVLPAGTIVTGSLTDRDKKVSEANDATAIGVTRYDVSLDDGDAAVAVVIAGTINLANIPKAPETAAKTALNNIIFMN